MMDDFGSLSPAAVDSSKGVSSSAARSSDIDLVRGGRMMRRGARCVVELSIRDKDAFASVAVSTRHVMGQTSEKGSSRMFLNVDCESGGVKLVESDGPKLVESDGARG